MKMTTNGTPIWGRGLTNTGSGNSYPQCLAPAPGNGVYLSGVFLGTNWIGTNRLTETAGASVYLARFDVSGNLVWVRTISGGGHAFQSYHQLVADPAGNVTISMLIQDNATFGATNVVVSGQKGALAQYDANGNLLWVQVPSGWINYLAYSAGRIYGSMGSQPTDFVGGLTNASDRHFALVALNAATGQGLWLRGIGSSQDQGILADTPAVAVSGTNVFLVGRAAGSNAVFGPFTVSWPDSAGNYFARYDTNGAAQLAVAFGSPTLIPWVANADPAGNVYVGGDFDTYARFGNQLLAGPRNDVVGEGFPGQTFVAKFDRAGNALWARSAQSQFSYVNLRDLALAATVCGTAAS